MLWAMCGTCGAELYLLDDDVLWFCPCCDGDEHAPDVRSTGTKV